MRGPLSSLRTRLLAVASVVMLVFTAVAVGVLENAFERAARNAVREQLNAQLYALLTAAEVTDRGTIYFPEALIEPRFAVVGSGLYAFVYDDNGRLVWHSDSVASAADAPAVAAMPVGATQFDLHRRKDDGDLFALKFGVAWESSDGARRSFTVVVAEDLARYRTQLGEFRRNLYFWSALGIAVLIVLQVTILNWAMRPLSRVAREIGRVEHGEQAMIEGAYPDEIEGLTRNINRLIESGQRSLDRYRNSLGDLAHSLKTPLAVLTGLSGEEADGSRLRAALEEQTRRMAEIVDYQLRRAASSAGHANVRPVTLSPVVGKIARTLDKVHAGRGIRFTCDIEEGLTVAIEEGDLMEVLGNLVENACKWCRTTVAVTARRLDRRVEVRVVDDGPGIDPARAQDVLARGVRADQKTPGQGIGLSIVRDIVESYGGSIDIGRSRTGGADVRIEIPSR